MLVVAYKGKVVLNMGIDFGLISIKQGKFELCGNTVIGESKGYPTRKVKVTSDGDRTSSEWDVHSTGLVICEFGEWGNRPRKWVIAEFKWNEHEYCYNLNSCCDRLNGIKDWQDFGILVDKAYELLTTIEQFT